MCELTKEKKKELKQFTLQSKNDYVVYLQNIIAIATKCMDRHKKYLHELENVLKDYHEGDKISHEIYSELLDKISNVESYLLNVFGDSQKISISYFKFRDKLIKFAKSNAVTYYEMTEDEEEILKRFNTTRNWQNHVPESLLTSEIELIKQGKAMQHSKNPIVISYYEYVTYEYMKDLLDISSYFHSDARSLLQSAKKDYSLLIGESVRIEKDYREKPMDVDHASATKMSARVQGL